MPDICMCESIKCPLRTSCYRNEASGTRPAAKRQTMFILKEENSPSEDEHCKYYLQPSTHNRSSL